MVEFIKMQNYLVHLSIVNKRTRTSECVIATLQTSHTILSVSFEHEINGLL